MSLFLAPDGPGTTIDLRDGLQGLPAAPRGTAAIMSVFQSGPTAHAALAVTAEQARLFAGDPDDNFEGNLGLSDIYSSYTPPVLIARVTDGNEVQARMSIWDRAPARSMSGITVSMNSERAPLATVLAHNGGRWGGRKRVLVGELAAIATDLTADTIDTGLTMLENVWAGASLYLEGETEPYTVLSNDTAGVLTIQGEFSQAAQDADGTGAIDGQWRLVLDHARELSVVIGQDSLIGSRFSMTAVRKFAAAGAWESVSNYGNLALSTDDDRPWTSVVADGEESRYQFALSTTYDGPTVEAKLPANFCEIPTDISAAGYTLTVQWYRWFHAVTNTGTARVTSVDPVSANDIEPHVYTLTFTSATAFNVTVTWPDGTSQSLTAGATTAEYVPDHPQLARFRVRAGGSAMAAGQVMTIRVDPLPLDLSSREAFLYPFAIKADGNVTKRFRIVSNTYKTVSVRSDVDLADEGVTIAEAPTALGSANISAANLASGNTIILTPDGGSSVTLTVGVGGLTGTAAIIAGLTALDTNSVFIFDEDPDNANHIRIRVRNSFGSRTSLLIGAGTGNATLGLTGSTTTYGVDGVPIRIEGRFPMWGGYDGVAPAASRYQLALDLSEHVFRRFMSVNLGLVRLCTPSQTGAAVKSAALALVEKHGWMYTAEFSTSILDGESAVSDMLDNESESDNVEHYFPSQTKFFNVAGTKLVERSVSAHIIGLRAALANVGADGEKGMHIAAANNNIQGNLSPRVQGLPDAIGRWTPPIKLLNDHGIVPILWEGPAVYLFGNRLYSRGRTQQGTRYTITERAVFYHIARDLFVTTRPFIFKTIGAKRLADIQLVLREKLKTYYQDSWFSDFGGTRPGFEQQVSVLVPPSLNDPASLQDGNVTSTIEFRPRPSLENLKIIITPTSLSSE